MRHLGTGPGNSGFWTGRKVFITGHTGFKGAWLCLWLHALGARVTGYALQPPTDPSLFHLCRVGELVESVVGDVRHSACLTREMAAAKPEVVIHMAAQPLVRESYRAPVETYATNVMGTVNLLEAVRACGTVRAVVNVTTDKCYENREWVWGYRENDRLGGFDPYSNSKACAELVTSAYRNSFFNPGEYSSHGVAVASARAGNVIGGGDFAVDRLVPDCIRALLRKETILVRNPAAIRPWQQVLGPLSGYLLLAEKLFLEGCAFSGGWNFGPEDRDARPVQWIVERLCTLWGANASFAVDGSVQPHEARYLKLECSKARTELGWLPRQPLEKALQSIVNWTQAYCSGKDMTKVCLTQIEEYVKTGSE